MKVINLANHNGHKQSYKPIVTQNIYNNEADCHKVWENVYELITMASSLNEIPLQRIMVVVFVIMDSIFNLIDTTTVIPCMHIS